MFYVIQLNINRLSFYYCFISDYCFTYWERKAFYAPVHSIFSFFPLSIMEIENIMRLCAFMNILLFYVFLLDRSIM